MEIKNNPFFGKMLVNLALAGAVAATMAIQGCTIQNGYYGGGNRYYKVRAVGKSCSGGNCGNNPKRYQVQNVNR